MTYTIRDLHDAGVPSDGLTVDTALGPVDTVAVDLFLGGWDVDLTLADMAFALARRARPDAPISTRRLMAYRRLAEAIAGDRADPLHTFAPVLDRILERSA
jgi:hypothetical protein